MLWEIYDFGKEFNINLENEESYNIKGLTKSRIKELKSGSEPQKKPKKIDYQKINLTTGLLVVSSFGYKSNENAGPVVS